MISSSKLEIPRNGHLTFIPCHLGQGCGGYRISHYSDNDYIKGPGCSIRRPLDYEIRVHMSMKSMTRNRRNRGWPFDDESDFAHHLNVVKLVTFLNNRLLGMTIGTAKRWTKTCHCKACIE